MRRGIQYILLAVGVLGVFLLGGLRNPRLEQLQDRVLAGVGLGRATQVRYSLVQRAQRPLPEVPPAKAQRADQAFDQLGSALEP